MGFNPNITHPWSKTRYRNFFKKTGTWGKLTNSVLQTVLQDPEPKLLCGQQISVWNWMAECLHKGSQKVITVASWLRDQVWGWILEGNWGCGGIVINHNISWSMETGTSTETSSCKQLRRIICNAPQIYKVFLVSLSSLFWFSWLLLFGFSVTALVGVKSNFRTVGEEKCPCSFIRLFFSRFNSFT